MRFAVCLLMLSGCFAVDDLSRFQTDEGCDLRLNLRRFLIHANAHRFDIEVVSGNGEPEAGTQTRAIAIFDPLPSPSLDIDMPGAVPPRSELEGQEGMSIDFWADNRSNGVLDPPGEDHSWRIDNACADGPIDFEHVLVFDRLPDPPSSTSLEVRICDSFPNAPVEVRVWEVDLEAETRRAVALYHASERPDMSTPLRIPKAIDAMQNYEIEVLIDLDDNGVFNGDDRAFQYDYVPENRCMLSEISCATLSRRGDACRTPEGNILLSASVVHARNEEDPFDSSWWRVAE